MIETRGEPVLEGDRPAKVVGTALDVTDRRGAADEIRHSQALSSSVIASALDCVVIIDSEGRVTEFNPAAEATFGYTREQALGAELAELIIPPQLRAGHRDGLARVLGSGDSHVIGRRVELEGMRADGTSFPVELAITRVSDDPPRFTGFLRDISERKRSERELELRAEQQAAVATLGREALAEADIQQLMEQATGAVARVLGVEFAKVLELSSSGNELLLRAAIGLPPESVGVSTVPAGANSQAGYTLATKEPVIVEDLGSETRFDGATSLHDNTAVSGISVVIDGSHGAFGVIAAHSTRPRRFTVDEAHFMLSIANVLAAAIGRERADQLELRLNQAQRLESVGQLAGGIAHDFNNLLSIIINYASFAINELDDHEQAREDVREVEKAAKRAAELTRQLLTFSRRELVASEVVDVNELVTDTESLLRHTVGDQIRFHMSLSPDLWRVKTGSAQFEQMLINLILNARDAMADGGELEVRTDNVEFETPVVTSTFEIPPGRYARLTVSDSGSGMAPEVVARAFEPFYTTKPHGKGTGLGLATVYGTVKQAGGFINLYSEVGIGTTLKIYLPATDADAEAPVPEPPREGLMGDGERILLVEDEDSLRAVAKRVLAGARYTVVEASGGAQAMALMEYRRGGPLRPAADGPGDAGDVGGAARPQGQGLVPGNAPSLHDRLLRRAGERHGKGGVGESFAREAVQRRRDAAQGQGRRSMQSLGATARAGGDDGECRETEQISRARARRRRRPGDKAAAGSRARGGRVRVGRGRRLRAGIPGAQRTRIRAHPVGRQDAGGLGTEPGQARARRAPRRGRRDGHLHRRSGAGRVGARLRRLRLHRQALHLEPDHDRRRQCAAPAQAGDREPRAQGDAGGDRARAHGGARALAGQLKLSREETVRRLSQAVEFRDAETGQHTERVSRYCELLAELEGLDAELLRTASPMHDVGKVAIPDRILLKPGKLTDEERREMERHAGSDTRS